MTRTWKKSCLIPPPQSYWSLKPTKRQNNQQANFIRNVFGYSRSKANVRV